MKLDKILEMIKVFLESDLDNATDFSIELEKEYEKAMKAIVSI